MNRCEELNNEAAWHAIPITAWRADQTPMALSWLAQVLPALDVHHLGPIRSTRNDNRTSCFIAQILSHLQPCA